MAAPHSVDPAELLEQHLASASLDLLREMIASFANAMMSTHADQVCGAGYGQRSAGRVNRRNGYRAREWDSRAGTVELAVPKLREGSFYPDWLLTHRQRAVQALVTVVATAYLLGVSTRRVERLAEQLGVKSLSRSQVSDMAALVATGVNADGHREILGLDVARPRMARGGSRFCGTWSPAAGQRSALSPPPPMTWGELHKGWAAVQGAGRSSRPVSGAGGTSRAC